MFSTRSGSVCGSDVRGNRDDRDNHGGNRGGNVYGIHNAYRALHKLDDNHNHNPLELE